ncbi:NAD(P)H-hydrate dehydratase [Dokdonella sp.]|uniref:NAD(P)H-hydrate dehydratase n=1 Tax=Dokdonella sp. TaxID=2291710 RepID=UPI002F42A827
MPTHDPSTSLYTCAQVRAIDRAATDRCGVAGFELMQRAATAAFASLRRRWPGASRIGVLAGAGNNGGDAFLLARLALQEGLRVDLLALTATSRGDAAQARAAFAEAGGRARLADAESALPDGEVLVDGLFGTGLVRPLDGLAALLVGRIAGVPVLALDVPSGLDADTGARTGPCVRADATVSFVGWKRGQFTADASDQCGVRELATLELPAEAYEGIAADAELVDTRIGCELPRRHANSNKSSFGHVLALGGDEGFGGAIRLTGEAALRCGAGLVSIATRAAHVVAITAARPELMARGIDDAVALAPLLERASVLALGPGLGLRDWGRALFEAALASGKRLVVDADALNLLAEMPRPLPPVVVLTPHPGEAARLLGCDAAAVQRDRFAAARELARKYAAVVVLKGAGSLVASPDGRIAVCPWGNPGMASAGMGDVLTGVVAALLAQGCDAWAAARLGVALHARAGDVAADAAPRGLVASDLFPPLRRLVNAGAA